MNDNVNEYFKAVSAYEMSLRFKKVNRDEAASYLEMTRDLIRRYIDGCNFITQDHYINVYRNVIKDAKDSLSKSTS